MRTEYTVLFIEDSAEFPELLRRVLSIQMHGHVINLVTARTLTDGLKCGANGDFDVILLDLTLPDSAGLSTIQKTLSACSHLPIVILTSYRDDDLAVRALSMGVQGWIDKVDMAAPGVMSRAIRFSIARHQAINTLVCDRARMLARNEEFIRSESNSLDDTASVL